MKEKDMYKIFGLFLLAICFLLTSISYADPIQNLNKKKLELKPDLIIPRILIVKKSETPSGGFNVQIAVTVINKIQNSCARNFKVKLEWAKGPSGKYTYLQDAGVVELCNTGSGIRVAKKILYFTDVIAAGSSKKYRATADPSPNRVIELNEKNNQNSASYTVPARRVATMSTSVLGSVGIDLVFKEIKIWKRDGYIYIQPTIRNQRSGRCSGGNLVFNIIGEAQQRFSSSFEGNSTFSLTGLGFRDNGNTSCFITLELSGTCSEIITSNNQKIVSLRGLSSTKKTIGF